MNKIKRKRKVTRKTPKATVPRRRKSMAKRNMYENLARLDLNLISLFFLCVFAISIFSLTGSLTKGAKLNLSGILLFVSQAIIGYVCIIYLVLPWVRKLKGKPELLTHKVFFVASNLVLVITGIGWLFRGSTFIRMVSFPALCISLLCLMGGIGVGLGKTLFSYTVFFSGLILLIIDSRMALPDYSLYHSIIFALSGLIYLELTGAVERSAGIGSRMKGAFPESDERTLYDHKVVFLKRFSKYCSITAGTFLLIMLSPLLFKIITAFFTLKGYLLMLSESVEINTLYIYLLPAGIAIMILVIIRFVRVTNKYSSDKAGITKFPDPPESIPLETPVSLRRIK